MSDYAVYIDEAGDLGIGRGTRWFVLTAVVVKKTVEPQIRARMTAIKACLNVREIHLRKITEFYKRAEEPSETAPDPDAGKHAFEVFLDCVALDDGLVQYLMEVLQKRDWKEFYKLSQITTKLDLDPEEFLYWLGNKELYVDEEERSCAVIMDACLERLRQEGQLELIAALLSGDRRTFELFRCQAPELQHLPAATYEWYSKNYLDRDYPIRMLMKCRGIRFPEHIPGNESK